MSRSRLSELGAEMAKAFTDPDALAAYQASAAAWVQEPMSLVQVHDRCAAIEVWAERCESIPEVQDASNKLAGIDEYLSRTSKEGRARVAAAMRRLEARIGDILGPAENGGDRGNQHTGGKCQIPHEESAIPSNRANEFRRFAANRDIVEATIAKSTDKTPATRSQVIRDIAAENTAKAHALQAQGLPQREIAAQLGVARAVVRRTLEPKTPPPARSEYHRNTPRADTSRIVEQTFYALDGLAHGIKQADVDQVTPGYAAEWAGNLRAAVSQITDFIRALDRRSKEQNG